MPAIKLGARWPDYVPEVAIDPGTIRAFVEAVEEMGYDHITAFDHPIAMPANGGPERRSAWTTQRTWHESLTLFSYMAGCTQKLGFMTAVFVLPLRPTLVVVKQVTSLDNYAGGRFRLGVSVGGGEDEYRALEKEFEHRGSRLEEQIDVMRSLWNNETTSYSGKWHSFPEIGLSSKPVNGTVPIWMGMNRYPPKWILRRVGRLADGILPNRALPDDQLRENLEAIYEAARSAGRDPSKIGFEPAVLLRSGDQDNRHVTPKKSEEELANEIKAWAESGATHIEFKTRSCGLAGLDQHLAEMSTFKQIADAVLA